MQYSYSISQESALLIKKNIAYFHKLMKKKNRRLGVLRVLSSRDSAQCMECTPFFHTHPGWFTT